MIAHRTNPHGAPVITHPAGPCAPLRRLEQPDREGRWSALVIYLAAAGVLAAIYAVLS